MERVFILYWFDGYEESENLAVFSNRESAERAKKEAEKIDASGVSFDIEEHKVLE